MGFAACDGGNGGTPTTYTIGGTVSGLTGTRLVLQKNGGDDLAITANGAFISATALSDGAAYNVTVLTQPTGTAQTCTITNGSGTVSGANVTTVTATCAPRMGVGGTWMVCERLLEEQ